jgi:hypothetical protein
MNSRKIEDFCIEVTEENGNYIKSSHIRYSEMFSESRVTYDVCIGDRIKFSLGMTREEILSLTNMLNEVVKYF